MIDHCIGVALALHSSKGWPELSRFAFFKLNISLLIKILHKRKFKSKSLWIPLGGEGMINDGTGSGGNGGGSVAIAIVSSETLSNY